MSVTYWGPFGFDLAFTRCKLTFPGIWGVCMYRALRFWESAQNGAATLIHSQTENPLPPHSTRPGTRNWSEFNWLRTALRTTARRNFSCVRLVCNRSKTGRKRGWRQRSDATEILTKNIKMYVKTSFFDVMSEVQKDFKDVSAGIGQIKNNTLYKNFARNLMSKLARSTLTSPSWIRVNFLHK
jgi:hypothetical protein